jgi:hypothetical protein
MPLKRKKKETSEMQNQKEKRKKNMIKGEIALVKLITTSSPNS